jgi:hypothetical protein
MRRKLHNAVVLLTVAAAAATGLPARAQGPDPRALEARKKCLAGDAPGGVALLVDLYIETRESTYLYNQARCYQQNGMRGQASERFREYLRTAPDLTPSDRQQTEAYIRELDSAPPATASALPPSAPAHEADQVTEPPSAGRTLRMTAMASGVAGAALVGSGLFFSARVSSLQGMVERQAASQGVVDRDTDRQARAAATWQWIGYGVGAAALAASAITYLLSRRATATGQTLALSPLLSPRAAGGAVRVGF